jgi:hypothetical protein
MPLLDVSFVTRDPMLADCFDVSRWEDVVGPNGRTTPTIVERFPCVRGVITQQSPSALLNKDDSTFIPRRILVATSFACRAASRDADGVIYQPDRIEWDGISYKVVDVLNYSRYGGGTYQVIAESQNAVDPVAD